MDKTSIPENADKVKYIGLYEYTTPTPLITNEETRLGFTDIIWLGETNKSKSDFLKYFDQTDFLNELNNKKKTTNKFSCEFAEDIGVPYFIESRATIYYSEELKDWKNIVEQSIKNKTLKDRLLDDMVTKKDLKANVLVHIAQDDTPNAKSEPKIKIYPKEASKRYPVPKGFTIEKENYNGMKFIGNYGW